MIVLVGKVNYYTGKVELEGPPKGRERLRLSDIGEGKLTVMQGDSVELLSGRKPRARDVSPLKRHRGRATSCPRKAEGPDGKSRLLPGALAVDGTANLEFWPRSLREGVSICEGESVEFAMVSGSPRDISNDTAPSLVPWSNLSQQAIRPLATLALKEPWFSNPKYPNSLDILWSYLWYTFFKLGLEEKIVIEGDYAVFNTGLVNDWYRDIFAVFRRQESDHLRAIPWLFLGFAVTGEGDLGRTLTRKFPALPDPPHYFTHASEAVLDAHQRLDLSGIHIVFDNIDRFPWSVVSRFFPGQIEPKGESAWAEFRDQFPLEHQGYGELFRLLESKRDDALKRTRWNFKTAVPSWYPVERRLQFLLPICLERTSEVDFALVVGKEDAGTYLGRTIFLFDWAYRYARLVCRPDSDWLHALRAGRTGAAKAAPQAEDGACHVPGNWTPTGPT